MATANTPNLDLERLDAGQASAEVTHNSALNKLDALVHLGVIDRDLTAPPGGESEGDVYIVGGSATGDWSGKDGDIAAYYSGWIFVTPQEGWIARIQDENINVIYDGSGWRLIPGGEEEGLVSTRIDNPVANDEAPLFYTNRAITVTEVRSVRSGGTSITWNLHHASDRSAAGTDVFSSDQVTTSTTTGDVDNTGFNDATIPAGSFFWVDVASVSGTPNWCEWFIKFTVDAV